MPTLYVTAPPDAAPDLASGLVEARLAACVNLVDCRSVYRWDGAVHDEDEAILLAKTTEDAVDACRDWLVDHHPYEVPCVERFAEDVLVDAFAEWRAGAVDAGATE